MSLVRNSCVGAVVAVLLLGGCGEPKDALSSAKRSIADQANPICEETRQKVGDLGGDPATERDAVQSAADRLKALPIPGDDEPIYKVFQVQVQNLALNLEDITQNRARAGSDPSAAAQVETAMGRARMSNEALKKAAAEYGLTVCAEGLIS
jgi:hypothetical protein